jgi:N-acetylmuramoyl-L-alanine amidase
MLYLVSMKKIIAISFTVFTSIIIYSCSQSNYSATNKTYKSQVKKMAGLLKEYPLKDSAGLSYADEFVGTTNMSVRRPNFVIIHHTAQNSCDQTLQTFTLARTQVSAHYVICRDGKVYHMLHDLLRAHHAGVSKWGNTTDLNSSSIGIELDNNGFEYFSDAQVNSLLLLLDRLKKAYSIPAANFIGHGDIAPTRKNDPNWRFPWKQLSEKGFGMWWSDTTNSKVPEAFDPLQALRIIGYDMKDSKAATIAFKRHWLQDTLPGLNQLQMKILYQLSKKFE